MIKRWIAAIAAGASVLCAAGAFAADEVAVPPLKARVTDLTGTLSAAQRQALEERLAAFEQRKGSQIAVLMLPTTQPETIEQYSIRVADAWKVGRTKVDDGVILVVAKADRKLRIEVGYGLEGAIPDAVAKRVVSDIIAPHFREGDFYGGIAAGTDALMKLIDGEPLPAPREQSRPGHGDPGGLVIALVIAAFVLGALFSGLLGRFLGAVATGGIIGVLAWVLVGALAAAGIAGLLAFVLVLVGGARRSLGGWMGGGFGGGGFGGGGFGGGGFSGGGGGFGGGGASGSW